MTAWLAHFGGSGEAASLAAMIEEMLGDEDLNLDRSKVFIAGLSAGGGMAAAMLAAYPELPDFLAKKQEYDPGELFTSTFYRAIKAMAASA